MISLIGAELRKLTTTRGTYVLVAAAVVVSIVTVADPGHSARTFQKPFDEQTFLFFTSLLTRVLILIMGIRVVTDEFRYGTILPSLLFTPGRSRLLVAKSVTAAMVGALMAGAAWAAMTAGASVLASSVGTTLRLGTEAWRSLGGMVGAGALWGVVGVGLGALIRSQVVAIVGGLIWFMGAEDIVRGWLGDAGMYLPGQAGFAMSLAPSMRALILGTALLLGYAAAAALSGALAMRRDVA